MRSELVDQALASFEGTEGRLWPHVVSGALYTLARDPRLTDEDRRRLSFEFAAWNLQESREKSNIWGTYFHPLEIGKTDDGSTLYHPDLKDIGPDAAICWAKDLAFLKNPFLRARYADLLWDLACLLREDATRDYESGRTAVHSYIAVANLSDGIEAAFALERAFQVSAELNDSELVKLVAEQLLTLANTAELTAIGIWSTPSRCFSGYRKLPEHCRTEHIRELERRLTEAAAAANGYAYDVAVDQLSKHYRGESGKENRRRLLRTLLQTYEEQASDPKISAGIAISWFEGLLARLDSEGLIEEADRLRLSIEELGLAHLQEMKSLSVDISINRKEIETSIKEIIAVNDPFLALFRLANHLKPNCNALRRQVKKHEKEFIFYSLFSRSIVGRDGLTKASIGSSENDMEGRMVEEAMQTLSLNLYFFRLGYGMVKEQFKFEPEDLMTMIARSYLCSPQTEESLLGGVRAYDESDYFKSISGLIPQVEGMLRELLKLLAIPVRKRTSRLSGISDMKNMSDILSEDGVVDALEEDLLFFIRIVFIDRRGWNLRNEVAHGLWPAKAFDEETASAVMMTLLLLAIIGPHGAYLPRDRPEKECAV